MDLLSLILYVNAHGLDVDDVRRIMSVELSVCFFLLRAAVIEHVSQTGHMLADCVLGSSFVLFACSESGKPGEQAKY
jgi:hypothetical protein